MVVLSPRQVRNWPDFPGHLTHRAVFLIAPHARMLTTLGSDDVPRRARRASRCRRIPPMRQITLVAFLQAQNCTNFASSWRHPLSRTDTWSPDYYRHLGRVLEEGKFHLGFFDDRLSMPDMYGHDHAHTVQHGIRCVKLDAVTVLTVMGLATERLGPGATYSTSYYEPFHVARVFATLDLMSEGRAAWNAVTSLNDGEAQNMGRDKALSLDLRYHLAAGCPR